MTVQIEGDRLLRCNKRVHKSGDSAGLDGLCNNRASAVGLTGADSLDGFGDNERVCHRTIMENLHRQYKHYFINYTGYTNTCSGLSYSLNYTLHIKVALVILQQV